MKKAYNIRINEKILKLLKEYDHDLIVDIDILRLDSYIKRLKNSFSEPEEISLVEKLESDYEYYPFYKPLYIYSKTFSNLGANSDTFKNDKKLSNIIVPDIEIMEYADIFFKEQGDFFYSAFSEFKCEAKDHLKFIKPNRMSDGETLMLKSTGEAFVFSPNYSNISKFTILIHELEHVIDFFNNPDFFDCYSIRETAAIFMELIACDFISKKYNLENDSFTRKMWIHYIVKFQAELLSDKMKMLGSLISSDPIFDDNIFEFLDKKGFEKSYVDYLLESTISEDFSYQLPYLIAVELYFIYKRNKSSALNILIDIIMNADNNNIHYFLNKYNIKPNSNIERYENILLKK